MTMREKQVLARAIGIQKKIGGNYTVFRDKQQFLLKALKYKEMYGVFLQLKLYYLWKMHGYPQFSFWIPKELAKFCFLQIVLKHAKYPCVSKHHP